MAVAWRNYQEEAAALFRSLGLEAETDVTLQGTRTRHDVDVLVKSSHVGFEVTWIVECKHWKTAINKIHVLGLRQIVADVGADRGILLSESGFQSGAMEAANLTNVQLTSLAELRVSATDTIYAMRLRDLHDRVAECKERYWEISKEDRILHGLRPDVGVFGYSGIRVIEICEELISRAFRDTYPFQCDGIAALLHFGKEHSFDSVMEVVEAVEEMIAELEAKLAAFAEARGNA